MHILISPVGRFLAALVDNILYAVRYLIHIFPGRRHLLLNMLNGNGNGRLSVEGHASCEHLKESDTETVYIALLVRVTASGLLGRSIMH